MMPGKSGWIVLWQLCLSQLRVGTIGFGGPLATMALMRQELVERRGFVSSERFLEGMAVVKLLPGPVSSLLAIFLGLEVSGILGGLLSLVCFVFPSFLLLLAVSIIGQWGLTGIVGVTAVGLGQSALGYLQLAVFGLILMSCQKLFIDARNRKYFGSDRPVSVSLIALVSGALVWARVPEVQILLGSLAVVAAFFWFRRASLRLNTLGVFTIFFIFFQAGATVFGTGYMIIPSLYRELVAGGLLDEKLFLDAVTWGNLTPGPIVIAATHMGFSLGAIPGAVAATVGIFAAPAIIMITLYPLLSRLLKWRWSEVLFLAVLPAVASTIFVSTLKLFIDGSPSAVECLLVVLAWWLAGRWPAHRLFLMFAGVGLLVGWTGWSS